MKKLRFLIVAILCLFLVSGCGNTQTASVDADPSAARDQVPEAETEPRALGMILVYGQPEAKPGEMIYAEDRRFQLDAAMFLDYIEGIKTTFMAAQNIGSSAHYFNTSNDEHKASADAKFDSAMQGEFTVYAYDIQYDGERIWFDPSEILVTCSGDRLAAYTIYGTDSVCEMSLAGTVPTASITVTCLKEEKELSTETLQAAAMDVYLTYPVPDGTDNVRIESFDADGNSTGQETIKKWGKSYDVWYDIGGFFLGHKTLNLEWR